MALLSILIALFIQAFGILAVVYLLWNLRDDLMSFQCGAAAPPAGWRGSCMVCGAERVFKRVVDRRYSEDQ